MENMYDKMRRVSANRQKIAQTEGVKQKAANSKIKLTRILEQKFKTTFIGALSQCEEGFGELWGHDKDDAERTPQEREWYRRWQDMRTNILNNGNNQLRAVTNELQQYTVTWEGYKLNLPVIGAENREEKQ